MENTEIYPKFCLLMYLLQLSRFTNWTYLCVNELHVNCDLQKKLFHLTVLFQHEFLFEFYQLARSFSVVFTWNLQPQYGSDSCVLKLLLGGRECLFISFYSHFKCHNASNLHAGSMRMCDVYHVTTPVSVYY